MPAFERNTRVWRSIFARAPAGWSNAAKRRLHKVRQDSNAYVQTLNDAYHEKFGFPFVMAVRGSSRVQILDAFEKRLENDYDEEFETALVEIHRIAGLRLRAMSL